MSVISDQVREGMHVKMCKIIPGDSILDYYFEESLQTFQYVICYNYLYNPWCNSSYLEVWEKLFLKYV